MIYFEIVVMSDCNFRKTMFQYNFNARLLYLFETFLLCLSIYIFTYRREGYIDISAGQIVNIKIAIGESETMLANIDIKPKCQMPENTNH